MNLEARALAAGSGVKMERRGKGRASNFLSGADAGHRRHIIALGLIALLEAIMSPPLVNVVCDVTGTRSWRS